MFESPNLNKSEVLTESTIESPEEAREYIDTLYEQGERPIVTVPVVYRDALAKGLHPHSNWLPGTELLVGTFARNPYLPTGEERVQVRVRNIDKHHIEPRFTGPDRMFHGVVVLSGPIYPEDLEIIH